MTGLESIDGACPDQDMRAPSLDYGVARHEDDKDTHAPTDEDFAATRNNMCRVSRREITPAGASTSGFQRRYQTLIKFVTGRETL